MRFDGSVLLEIADRASASYPYEGCGALLGRSAGHVSRTLPIPNSETGLPRVRFEVAPRDYLAVEREADRQGLLLLGFWHSHPDHPARPSSTDRAFAWEGLLTVIVSVLKREPGAITAWELLSQDAPFTPVPIENEAGEVVLSLLSTATLESVAS